MLELNNAYDHTHKDKSWVVQSVVFFIALWVSSLLCSSTQADGPINIIEWSTSWKQFPLGHLGLEETVKWIWIIWLWSLANTQGWWVNIHIPMEDIEDVVVNYCSSNLSNFIMCLDMYLSNK